MIIGKIAQAVLKLIMPNVIEHIFKVGKLDKLLKYMELPNDADLGVQTLRDEMDMVKGTLKDMSKKILPPSDFPISKEQAEELLGFMKKIKNKSKFKIG